MATVRERRVTRSSMSGAQVRVKLFPWRVELFHARFQPVGAPVDHFRAREHAPRGTHQAVDYRFTIKMNPLPHSRRRGDVRYIGNVAAFLAGVQNEFASRPRHVAAASGVGMRRAPRVNRLDPVCGNVSPYVCWRTESRTRSR